MHESCGEKMQIGNGSDSIVVFLCFDAQLIYSVGRATAWFLKANLDLEQVVHPN
jgi:hypothetical protein